MRWSGVYDLASTESHEDVMESSRRWTTATVAIELIACLRQ